jgi:GH25 family lysozyme M1 (1,4-beta-N-acetylmuramidase)
MINLVPPVQQPYTLGLDISEHQYSRGFDYSLARTEGVSFALVRASIGQYPDARYAKHHSGCWWSGLLLGSYHFLKANVVAAKQANVFFHELEEESALDDEIGPALDVEEWGLTPDIVRRWLDSFLRLAPGGTRVLIYSRASYWRRAMKGSETWLKDYPLDFWVADYSWQRLPDIAHPLMPRAWEDWRLWQYTSRGRLAAYPGHNLDLNVFRGPLEALCDART